MTNARLEEESGERDAAATSGKSPKARTYSTRSPALTSAAAFSQWKETGAEQGLCAPTAFARGAEGPRELPAACAFAHPREATPWGSLLLPTLPGF